MIRKCTRIHGEEQIASLIAAAGVIWGVKVVTSGPLPATAIVLPLGPLGTCGVGILIWLHAKWRRSLKNE
ncbi:MAG: hypothetical protein LAN64_08630 [Acidobacteriia bacterium]|nr:hypothetical protein [Terriglobia bacterium]